MHARDKYAQCINEVTALLQSKAAKQTKIPPNTWEDTYKCLRGIKKFFGTDWDTIRKEMDKEPYNEEWIWKAREDESFKKYYQLRSRADKWEVLAK